LKTFNNEIEIHKGESFTIDKTIENRDGSPYIISSRLSNAYFLITIASSKYYQSDRYIKNYWLSLANFPRFLCTKPIDLSSIKVSATSDESKYDDFPSGQLLEGYVDGQYVKYDSADDAVFYRILDNGRREYKYFSTVQMNWINYSCRLVKTFSSSDTSELVEQNYVYGIKLISGVSFDEHSETKTGDFDLVLPILAPTKLSVLNDIDGGILY
jgi:hypothetical protein